MRIHGPVAANVDHATGSRVREAGYDFGDIVRGGLNLEERGGNWG